MKSWWLVALCVTVLSLHALEASAGLPEFPNFPTVDDQRVVVGKDVTSVEDDDTDDDASATIKMTHMRVRSEIALRYARTAVICKVYNPGKRPKEASFNILLPETAFISGFTMTIANENYEAYVKEKEDANKIYNDAVAQGNSAAHVAAKARDSNHMTIKFNVEGRCNATYRLTYEEFLIRRNGVYNHVINLLPGMYVPKMDVGIHIKESQKISVLRVPELRTGNEVDPTEKDPQYAKAIIKRGTNEREATITFRPDLVEQKRLAEIYAEKSKLPADADSADIGYNSEEEVNKDEGLLGQFIVQYDVDQPKNGEVLVNDGYFVHFFAPKSLPPLRKHVVFVLDTSASMGGIKIKQLKKAMNAILSELNPKDYISIINFNSYVTVHNLQKVDMNTQVNNKTLVPPANASPENIAAAKAIISKLITGGGTDIYNALDSAMTLVQVFDHHQSNQTESKNNTNFEPKTNEVEPMIIFLTDGVPVAEERNTDRIVAYISEKNSGLKPAMLFTIAFGDDADRVFLRQLALRNHGFMRYIYESADAAIQLHDFYRQVSTPLLSDVKFVYPRRQIKEGSVSRSQFRTINHGSEVAVVGRIAEDVREITPQVRGLRGEEDGSTRLYEINNKVPVTRSKDQFLPLERLWAYLTIKQLLDKRDADINVADKDATDDNPEKKALAIALKYSFVTSLTSLVVVRLNKTDAVDDLDVDKVDEPSFLPYKQSSSIPFYTVFASGGGLSVDSSEGPVLFVQSTKRFTATGYDVSSGGHGGGSGGGYNGGDGAYIYGFGGGFANPNWSVGKEYHLKGYEWTSFIYRNGSLVLQVNGTEVVLKLSKDVNPPKAAGGDAECYNTTLTYADDKRGVCVYITRCYAAQNFNKDFYLNSYCFVDGYAGVCCPKTGLTKPNEFFLIG
ncbi:inter-alpha-trypsin inhibitor heavy chain H4 [Bicyclus anynana]|uniref:Inter-alpha-trypsin inhibitor heavy chain H4 n=1 Tax=Bicyclus anynana TaxID=110368 RepID=A0A6J1PB07_BICAN|nr:inter-alpha-trypsin inhibitor heavy chain H4 [Bicyclus anynana]